MNKISLIIKREYLTRVKKKSFVIMTILGPILMAAVMILPIYLSNKSDKVMKLWVVDDTGMFENKLTGSKSLQYEYRSEDLNDLRRLLHKDSADAILHFMNEDVNTDIDLVIFYESQLGLSNIEFIRSDVKNIRDDLWLWNKYGIDRKQLESNNVQVDIMQIENKGGYGADRKKSQPVSLFIIAMFSGIIIYFFIFMFGVQVLRGVIEEKTSRIVEIIISSVKPFQLMMGKIIGVALVGLTQFLLWIVFTFVIVGFVAFAFPDSFSADNLVQEQFMSPGANLAEQENLAINKDTIGTIEQLYMLVNDIPVTTIIFSFLFYFLFGYLMYSALFAAVGAAVDNEADTQQFMLPITIPLILGLIMSSFILNNPSGPVAVWLSIIPFTSPIVMMMRIPFGVPIWELVFSMVILVASFLFVTWIAGKIYKTGILMYGKKPSYKEIWKWIKYKG